MNNPIKSDKKKKTRLRPAAVFCLAFLTILVFAGVGCGIKALFSVSASHQQNNQSEENPSSSSSVSSSVNTSNSLQERRTDHQIKLDEIKNTAVSSIVNTAGLDREEIRSLFAVSELDETIMNRIRGTTWLDEQDFITPGDLRYIKTLYKDFNGNARVGELIANVRLADELAEIFCDLYLHDYQIAQMVLPDEYGGDDNISMANNNTSCFSFRLSDGAGAWAHEHAIGLAVDINPLNNPMVITAEDGSLSVYPANASAFADRTSEDPHVIKEGDYALSLFLDHGFTWGGSWQPRSDYQHFEKYYEAPAVLPDSVQQVLDQSR